MYAETLNEPHTIDVLLVEDHKDLAITVGSYLEGADMTVDYASDGQIAYSLATANDYDCIVLDLMLPKMDGMEVCRRLRDSGHKVPILMLTARDQLSDKLEGFNTGSDDYMVKPFELPELEARINSLVRRARDSAEDIVMRIDDLEFDTQRMIVRRGGKRLKLSPTGMRILKILMRESPHLVTREAIENELWGELLPASDTLRSHIYNLRKIIDRGQSVRLLHTVQSMGFKIAHPKDL
ncbi:MAG: response regulator transcription factor [Gammaproteobacteria bacterium]|nr:response regulator transcription factor [Gammaproteobacteria bacterium]